MPTHNRFRLDDCQRVPPARPRPSQDRPEEPIEGPQSRSWAFPLQDGDLLAKRKDLDGDIGSGLEEDAKPQQSATAQAPARILSTMRRRPGRRRLHDWIVGFTLRSRFGNPQLLPVIEIPAGAVGVRQPRLPAPLSRRVSPPEDRRRPGIPSGVPRQSAEMARRSSGLLAAVSPAASGCRRAEPRAAASSGPKTSAARSCKQQLSFRPKTFRRWGLAAGARPAGSCKQQPSSGANLGFRSTSAA